MTFANRNTNDPSGRVFRILVVDDDDMQRRMESEILKSQRYQVTAVDCGEAALAALRENEFDAVLLDRRMPGMDGNEVCRRVRGTMNNAMLPIIVVTGNADERDLAESMRAGASDFIHKPYKPVELLARVEAAVERKRLTDQLDSAESLLFALARMVEAKDANTGDHCTRLAHYSQVFGKRLGLNAEELLALRRGGVLHDIGKIGIPDRILLKPGNLDADEWVIMRQHTVIGSNLCAGLRSMRLTVPIIRSHHERFDGSGYPDGLKGHAIPLLARVFQIVDIYDALASVRSYKEAWPHERIVQTLEEERTGGRLDPDLVSAFLELLRNDPGSLKVTEAGGMGAELFDAVSDTSPDEAGRTSYGPVTSGSKASSDLGQKTVLIVDDDRSFATFVQELLQGEGYHTMSACDGEQALRALQKQVPDLLLTDVFMPVVEGIELIRRVREIFPGLPIIAMSGSNRNSEMYVRNVRMLGADDAFYKPFESRDLLASIARLLCRGASS